MATLTKESALSRSEIKKTPGKTLTMGGVGNHAVKRKSSKLPTLAQLKKQLEVGQAQALKKGEANAQRLIGRARI